MARATRPRLPEWDDFADALKELVTSAGLTKSDFAQLLGRGFDRGRAGAILEAREPCPEELLVRLCKASAERRYQRLRDLPHLHLLVDLWERAAGSSPGPLLRAEMRRAGEALGGNELSARGGAKKDGNDARLPAARRLRHVVPLLFLLALIGVAAALLRPASNGTSYTASHVTHSFPGDHAGAVHLTIAPLPPDAGLDFYVDLRWGPWTRHISLPRLHDDGVTVVFTKLESGSSVPLSITVSRLARLRVGIGEAEGAIDVNEGWTREPP